jgi:hypothetical protein
MPSNHQPIRINDLGAAVNPGPGPRVVKHSLSLGPLYLPPLLVGLTALAIAGLVAATGVRWAPATGAAFAAVLMVGAATLGSAQSPTGSPIPAPSSNSPKTPFSWPVR